jgi:hypothetical protein
MRQDMQDEDAVRVEMDRGDDPIFVSTDVKNMASLVSVDGIECGSDVSESIPYTIPYGLMPSPQRFFCCWISLPELAKSLL